MLLLMMMLTVVKKLTVMMTLVMVMMTVVWMMAMMFLMKPLGSQDVCPGSFFFCWVFAVVVFRGGSYSVKFHER